MPGPIVASYLLAAFAVLLVLHFHLLPAVFAGLAVHILTIKLARRLPANWARWAHEIALAVITVLVISVLIGAVLGLWSFMLGKGGVGTLLATVADTLEKLRLFLPASVANALPDRVDELHEPLTQMLREHGRKS
jgi:hypothetical protein